MSWTYHMTRLLLLFMIILLAAGCTASFEPRPLLEVNFMARAQTQSRGNLTGDPYFTDGNRAVLWVASQPTAFSDVGWLNWEEPTRR